MNDRHPYDPCLVRANTTKSEGSLSAAAFVRKKEVAEHLNISVRQVSYYQSKGILPFYKPSKNVVLFRLDEVNDAMEEFRRGGHALRNAENVRRVDQ